MQTITFEQAQEAFQKMDKFSTMLMRQAASQKLQTRCYNGELDEIGTSDVSCMAIEMLRQTGGKFPTLETFEEIAEECEQARLFAGR